jgi:lipoprotein-anchoring transpeptidase ErfK/SrfK
MIATMRLFLTFLFLSLTLHAQESEPKILKALPVDADPVPAEITPPPVPVSPPPKPAAPPVVPPAPPKYPEETPEETPEEVSPIDQKPIGDNATRLQIFLDQANFGPGVIDGKIGLFSELAVKSWNEVNGHPLDDWSAVNTAARETITNPYAVALVPEIASEWVNSKLSHKRSEQAKTKRMAYRSIAEFMSERYHTDIPTLIRLNPEVKIYGLQPKASINVPNVTPFLVEELTDRAWKELEDLSDRYVVVDTKMNQVRIFAAAPRPAIITDPNAPAAPVANTALLASFPITPGKPQFVKFGSWKLQNMVALPWWRYDQQLLDTGKRSENALMIPPGPNSPVGIIWCGTTRAGIGMHGTSDPETIGRSRSAGCIRLCNWDAIRLPNLIRPGATVEIR